MGACSLFVIVEGRIDRPFFRSIADQVLADGRSHIGAIVRCAKELPDATGGKGAVLAYYDFLRRAHRLTSTIDGKRTVVVFCLDKDLDDFTRRKRRSRHVVYTEFFDVESYIFKFGDLLRGTAAATTVDIEAIAVHVLPNWTVTTAAEWKDWVAICFLEITQGFHSTGNYAVCPSPINDRVSGLVVPALLIDRLALIHNHSALTQAEFDRRWTRARQRVVSLFASGQADRVFKGKWYAWLLARSARNACAGREADLSKLDERLPLFILSTLNFAAEWARPLRESFAKVVDEFLPAGIAALVGGGA